MLQGSGFINIHVGQYGCEDICLSIIEKQEYLIKQGESSGKLIVIRKIVRLYKECELPDLVFVASLIYLILYLVFLLLLLYKHLFNSDMEALFGMASPRQKRSYATKF